MNVKTENGGTQIFAIYDKAVESFARPFFVKTEAEAKRAFVIGMGDENSFFSKSPHDFDLYKIGYFFENQGTIASLDSPSYILSGLLAYTEFVRLSKQHDAKQQLLINSNED